MQKAIFCLAGLILMIGGVGCDYDYKPMDAKAMSEHPLKPLPVDYRAQIWLKLAPTYSRRELRFSRWDFFVPQAWEEGYLMHDHPVGEYTYQWRCDVNVTFLKPKHQDEQKRYTFVYKDGDYVPEDMAGDSPKDLVAPMSALPYNPYDLTLNQVAALSAHLPDKTWTVDNRQTGIDPTPGIRALYFSRTGQGVYDSAVYLVEKLGVLNGWKYIDDIKIPAPIAETPVYYVYAYKGPGAWPTFDADVMAALFPGSPDDPGAKIGPRP